MNYGYGPQEMDTAQDLVVRAGRRVDPPNHDAYVHGYNFYGSNGPKVIPGFLQFFELIQFEACKGFADSFKFTDNLIEKCTLILVWLASVQSYLVT